MDADILIPILAIISVLLIPILGLTIVFTTRFALKPLAETLAKALRESGISASTGESYEVRKLAEQVEVLTQEVRRLRELQEFDGKLLSARPEPEQEIP